MPLTEKVTEFYVRGEKKTFLITLISLFAIHDYIFILSIQKQTSYT